jgi:hypothetical protein
MNAERRRSRFRGDHNRQVEQRGELLFWFQFRSRRAGQHFLAFVAEIPPHGVGGLANSGFLHQFPRHRAHQVFVGIESLQTFAGKLALHHERDQHLLAH